MSFQEKSALATLVVFVGVFGWYFASVMREAASTPVDEIEYAGLLIVMTILLILLVAVAHAAMAVAAPKRAGHEDERDRLIELRGIRVGAYVLGTGIFFTLVMTMAETPYFWIAHGLLAVMVVAEIVENVTKLVLYRQGV